MKSKRYLRAIGLLSLLALACPPDALALQFRMLAWGPHDSNLMFDRHGKGVETAIAPAAFSDTYEFDEESPLVLYKRVRQEKEIVRQTACTVIIPPTMQQGLLLLVPDDDSQVKNRNVVPDSYGTVSANAPMVYKGVWLDDSLETRPEGSLQFINLTPRQMALRVGGEERVLAPLGKLTVPLIAGSKRMDFQGAVMVDGEWKIFSRKPIPTRDPARLLVILRENEPAAGAEAGDKPSIRVVPLFDWHTPAPVQDGTTTAAITRPAR